MDNVVVSFIFDLRGVTKDNAKKEAPIHVRVYDQSLVLGQPVLLGDQRRNYDHYQSNDRINKISRE